ncbi:hypothetical protein XENORESO_004946 [Xenotaenia resolanae]|uniref:Uncharacterized protein n=1 Tax=Xenotaenia resolanae TaxID=208358 RepID=A0ABV0WR21_9TELE
MDNLCCASCSAPLQPEEGHDMCPPCLGVDHLREVLSDHACSDCSVLPERCVCPGCPRRSSLLTGRSLSSRIRCRLDKLRPRRRGSAADVPLASGRTAKQRGPMGLSTRVDQLSTELAQMKALLQSLRADGGRGETSPPELGGSLNCDDNAISVAAWAPFFERTFRSWAPGPQVRAPVPLREVQGNRCLRLLERLWAVCSWMFPQPSLLHLAPSLGVVMPRPPLSLLPRRSTSRSCMLAGWTRGPFPARRRMAGPWLPCMRRPSLGWAACPLSNLPLPLLLFLLMRR